MMANHNQPVTLNDLPFEARLFLDEVIEHHRDRDDFPVFFRVFYVLHEEKDNLQALYDRAVAILRDALGSAPIDSRTQLEATVGRYNSETILSPVVVEKLRGLDDVTRLAHAWAAHYMFSTFGALVRYLNQGVPSDSRLLATYPEMERMLTPKDNLLPVGQSVVPGYAWVTYKQHDIHPHPGLRRGLRSKVHYDLLALLWRQLSVGNLVSIAVDHFRFCPKGELRRIVELDAWFGAPFSIEEIDNPWKVGATVHGRTRDFSPTEPAGLLTEFRWSCADGLKTFEAEELPPVDLDEDPSAGPIVCRYVHSIRDIATKRFVHLDGALTIYARDAYRERYKQALNHHAAKVWATDKVKLFRVDAPALDHTVEILPDAWTELIISFFRGNELVLEYFDGRTFGEIYRSRYGHEFPYWDH